MLADTRHRTRPTVRVGALSEEGATALGLGLVLLGGGLAVVLWKVSKVGAAVMAIGTMAIAPKVAAAST